MRFQLFGLNSSAISDLDTTLAAVASIMANCVDPWWIIGSAAVSLHLQHDVGGNDIDVLLSVSDAVQIRRKLDIPFAAARSHPLFDSDAYFSWDHLPLPVEFMAGFSVRTDDGWREVAFHSRQSFVVSGQTLYAPNVEELSSLLRSFGRPKDLARLALLAGSAFSV